MEDKKDLLYGHKLHLCLWVLGGFNKITSIECALRFRQRTSTVRADPEKSQLGCSVESALEQAVSIGRKTGEVSPAEAEVPRGGDLRQ